MGTFSKTFINIAEKQKVIQFIDEYFSVHEVIELPEEVEWKFNNNFNQCFIVAQNYNSEWIELYVDFVFQNYFSCDEFIRRLTDEYYVKAILAYYQTTSGEGRVAHFDSGCLVSSFTQQLSPVDLNSCLKLSSKFNITDLELSIWNIPDKVGHDFFGIDYDTIYEYYKLHGISWDGKEREELFTHIQCSPK